MHYSTGDAFLRYKSSFAHNLISTTLRLSLQVSKTNAVSLYFSAALELTLLTCEVLTQNDRALSCGYPGFYQLGIRVGEPGVTRTFVVLAS